MKKLFIGSVFILGLLLASCSTNIESIGSLKITYESEHGTVPEAINVKFNQTLTEKELPELTEVGYTFVGWFKDNSQIKPGYKINRNLKLVAKWNDVAPNCVTDLKAITGDQKITLTWTNPIDKDFLKVLISKDGETPIEVQNASTYEFTNLTNGQKYNFTIETLDIAGNKSSQLSIHQFAMNPFLNEPKLLENYKPNLNPRSKPAYGTNWKYVEFGYYPQSHKAADVMVDNEIVVVNGWNCYRGSDGFYYIKATASPFTNPGHNNPEIPSSMYYFDDKTAIKANEEYFYKLEPIVWRVLTESYTDGAGVNQGNLLLAEKALLARRFDSTSAVYETSEMRKFLNSEFLNNAFNIESQNYITDVEVKKSGSINEGGNTIDKIFLISREELMTREYGLYGRYYYNNSISLHKTSDYSRAMGADAARRSSYIENDCGWWWFRTSITNNTVFSAWGDTSGSTPTVPVTQAEISVVPALCIKNIKF